MCVIFFLYLQGVNQKNWESKVASIRALAHPNVTGGGCLGERSEPPVSRGFGGSSLLETIQGFQLRLDWLRLSSN